MANHYSITEIAKLAGVSATTVSRVFHGDGYVKEETKASILQIAKENGYQPRQYKKRRTLVMHDAVVGIVVPDIENAFFQQIIRAIVAIFDQHGIETVICDINEDPNKEIRSLSLLKQLNVDGIIITPASENAEYNRDFLKELHEKGMPIIMLDRDVKGIGLSGVFQNSYDGAYNAVNKLIEMGHERIAIVGGPITSKPGLDRMVGYMDALKYHDITVRQEYILYGDFKTESGYALTKQLLREHPKVTAIFSANNLMSIGSLQAIKEAGLAIPEDISFVAYGALNPYDINQQGTITELVEPTELMGYECAHLMLEKMSAGKKKSFHVAKRVSFDTSLLLRGSEVFPIHRK
ncbi:MAG: LacI family DNA-binding transcriptional regulator [Clostridia bacterium]